jgi:hypothetical protein
MGGLCPLILPTEYATLQTVAISFAEIPDVMNIEATPPRPPQLRQIAA